MPGMGDQIPESLIRMPGIGDHPRPESVISMPRNTQRPTFFVDPTGKSFEDIGNFIKALGSKEVRDTAFNRAADIGDSVGAFARGAYGAGKGAVTGLVGVGVAATEFQAEVAVGAAELALTGDPTRLHDAASDAAAVVGDVTQELRTTARIAKEAIKNPGAALDAATELGIEGTAEVLGGATFEAATLVAPAPKGAAAVARAGREGTKLARAVTQRARGTLQRSIQEGKDVIRGRNPAGQFVASPLTPARRAVRRAARTLDPRRYTSSRVKGIVGRELARGKAFLRGEQLLGREISLRVGGTKIRADLVTRTRSGQIRVIEAKFGQRSRLTQNQKDAFPILRLTGEARFFGARAQQALGKAGIDVGSGVTLRGVGVKVEPFFGSRAKF